jgi:hypothetical protein
MKQLPLLHVTDLYHPPQDPDDQIDLATVAALDALGDLDLKGVVLDITRRFLEPEPAGADIARDPGFVITAQLGYLMGRPIPTAMGPLEPLRDPEDDASDRPAREQAGIRFILDTLAASDSPVLISCVGSARPIAAAFNRNPELMREKTRAVLLNAGSTAGSKVEWNVGLDPAAYTALWQSGLPIDWYPCATPTSAFNPEHERGTFWKAAHADLFKGLPQPLKAWFAYGYTGSARGDITRALDDLGKGPVWDILLADSRNLWSTASLVMAAGRVLARTQAGWRFANPEEAATASEIFPWRLDPITASVDDHAIVTWSIADSSHTRLFGRQPGLAYAQAMTEALNALLRGSDSRRP